MLRQQIAKATISILVTILLWVSGSATLGQSPSQAGLPATLRQRLVRPKPARTLVNPAKFRTDVIVVKFREGTHVRERAGQLEADLTNLSDVEESLLQRANLPRQRLFQELAQVNGAIAPNSKRFVRRLFTRPEDELNAEKRGGERQIGEELADLNLYYKFLIADATREETERLIDQLNALDIVEIAYAQPISENAAADVAPTTPNLSFRQSYLNAAATGLNTTNGIDAVFARNFPGTRGDDVRIIDIEQGWNLTHEDMPSIFFQAGQNSTESGHRQHGTAVLGVMASAENGFGMTGIAPQSRIGVSSNHNDDFADAVNRAAAALRFGDIMLLEQHAPGPDSGLSPTCNAKQFEFVPMEFFAANFDAIKNATANGVIVVEAAGNGSMNLDSSIYNGKFDRNVRDSGAILAGAGSSAGRVPLCFTNFGSRVDVQGWGENVASLGRGDFQINGTDDNQWYTFTFNGTSSASPIVAGAAASVQGLRKARGLSSFTSVAMRNFLRQTGVAQATSAKQIGPLPNLRAAIEAHEPKRSLKVTLLSIKVVDNIFPGPHALSFKFTVNNKVAQFPNGGGTASFPQNTVVNLPPGFSLIGQEILDEGLVVQVSTNLRAVVTVDPKTGAVISVVSRPVQVLHFFPTGTNFSSSFVSIGGSRTFTERSTDASGFFELTYRVEQLSTRQLSNSVTQAQVLVKQ